jgi:hypothetical protein
MEKVWGSPRIVELSRNEESALRRISVGIDQSEMRPREVARLKLLALVEMCGSAVVLTPIGVRRVAKLPDRWEVDEPEWPTLRLAGGGGKEGEIDALDLLRCRREARA